MARKSGFVRMLTPKERTVVGLSALLGVDDAGLAEVLSTNQGALRQIRLKALRKLREQ